MKTSKDIKKLPYRKNISCIIFANNKFLLVQQIKWSKNLWKFPQGGIKRGETEKRSARREILEELNIKNIRFFGKSSFTNKYNWDKKSVKLAGYRWKGQVQNFLIVEYLGNNKKISINKKELKNFKWVNRKELASHIDHKNKSFACYKKIIEKVLDEFKSVVPS